VYKYKNVQSRIIICLWILIVKFFKSSLRQIVGVADQDWERYNAINKELAPVQEAIQRASMLEKTQPDKSIKLYQQAIDDIIKLDSKGILY